MTRDDELLARVADWLALRDPDPEHVDLVLLLGAALPDGWDRAARLVTEGRAERLMVVGGHGHTTDLWLALVGAEPGRTEASVMAEHLARDHGLTDVLVEDDSTNCGDNIRRALAVARAANLSPRTVALVQDPSMQRRVDAVFRLARPGAAPVNLPAAPPYAGLTPRWPDERWRQLVVGEVPRLRDDAHGYGPRGAGHQAHVDVPDDVEAACAELVARHPDWARPADPRHRS